MNKTIIAIVGITLLPLSIAFADTNPNFVPSEQPAHKSPIEAAPNVNSTIIEENQTNGASSQSDVNNSTSSTGDETQMPSSQMQMPDSQKNGNVGEPQDLRPSEPSTNSPTRYPDPVMAEKLK